MEKKPEITPERALQNLYEATRLLTLPAQNHEILRACAEVLDTTLKNYSTLLTPPVEDKTNGVMPKSIKKTEKVS